MESLPLPAMLAGYQESIERGKRRTAAYSHHPTAKSRKSLWRFLPTSTKKLNRTPQLAHTAATKLVAEGFMKTFLFLSLLVSFLASFQVGATNDGSPMAVSSFKWSRARQKIETNEAEATAPARAMIPQNKNFARNARINDPQGVRDPNADTLDGRSEAMEKTVAESRAPKSKWMDGYAYRIKVQNASTKVAEIVFWEYQFLDPSNPQLIARRQFLCGVSIPAGKGKELEGFSLSGPSEVVNVKTLEANATSPFKENVLINRVEYSDGSIWERKGWNLVEVKGSYERVLREQWIPGTCKGL